MQNNIIINKELISFIKNSPSAFHASLQIENMLVENGFLQLFANEKWEIENGKSYYTKANNSSILAFTMPEKPYDGAHIVAAHSDSPAFKIKANPEIESEEIYITLNVEKYGGMIINSWFDRALSIAGRVIINNSGALEQRLVNIDKDLLLIPNLAIHMSRGEDSSKNISVQKELQPLLALKPKSGGVNAIIAKALNIEESAIIDSDLFLYCRQEGKVWGANDEFLSAPRLDDLQCAFCAIKALLNAKNESKICMSVIFDNEEVGSGTKQGALSTFLAHTLRRIGIVCNKSEEEMLMVNANTTMISADNGHAVHPNYPEKADITNRPVLGKGILIKYSANQKYTTDAFSGATVRKICDDADIPYQIYHNNSDVLGGSTLGNLSTMQLSVPCADIGAAMLAMHSPYETTSCEQTEGLLRFMSEYFGKNLIHKP